MGLAEKYRPRTLDEVVGQPHAVQILRRFVEAQRSSSDIVVPHMLFAGPPGVGKTSAAYAFAADLGWPIVELNASDERGIDVIRSRVKQLARRATPTILLLDEADAMTIDAQQALRRIIETAPKTRFILTANYPWKIISPLHSRLLLIPFKPLEKGAAVDRIVNILLSEGYSVESDEELEELEKAIEYAWEASRGDMRRMLNIFDSILRTRSVRITVDLVKAYLSPPLITRAMEAACGGELDKAVDLVEQHVASATSMADLVEPAYQWIKNSSLPLESRARLLLIASEAERALRIAATAPNAAVILAALAAAAFLECSRSKGREAEELATENTVGQLARLMALRKR